MKTKTYYLRQAVHNSNVYTRIAAYQLAMGMNESDVMLFMLDNFSLTVEEVRGIMP